MTATLDVVRDNSSKKVIDTSETEEAYFIENMSYFLFRDRQSPEMYEEISFIFFIQSAE